MSKRQKAKTTTSTAKAKTILNSRLAKMFVVFLLTHAIFFYERHVKICITTTTTTSKARTSAIQEQQEFLRTK